MSDDASKQAMIKAIKDAVMVEVKGQQLYNHAAKQTEDPAARSMFEVLARDEDAHVKILTTQYRALTDTGHIDLSKVDPAEVIEVYGLSRAVGLDVAVDQIERHVSQGGRVLRVIEALRLASTTKLRLKWRDLCQRDLAGEDVGQVVKERMKELETSGEGVGEF